jgi:hypothetical protein
MINHGCDEAGPYRKRTVLEKGGKIPIEPFPHLRKSALQMQNDSWQKLKERIIQYQMLRISLSTQTNNIPKNALWSKEPFQYLFYKTVAD